MEVGRSPANEVAILNNSLFCLLFFFQNEGWKIDKNITEKCLKIQSTTKITEINCSQNFSVNSARVCCATLCLSSKTVNFQRTKACWRLLANIFLALFTTTMIERNCSSVRLDLCPDVVQDLLEYLYTGKVTFTKSNVKGLIVTADYLLVSNLKQEAEKYLRSVISEANCMSMYVFAVHSNCDKLKADATSIIGGNFASVSKTNEFLNLDFNLLLPLVSYDAIIVATEEEVFEAVLRWVKHEEDTRTCHFEELFKSIHLFSLSKEYIQDNIRTEPLVNRSEGCMEFLIESLNNFSVHKASRLDLRPRRCQENDLTAIVLMGGLCEGRSLKSTLAYFPAQNLWHRLADMNSDRNEHAVVECGGLLYCVGGYPRGSSVERFDPLTNEWTQMADLLQRTFAPAAVSCDGCIYVFGGKDGFEALSTVQCYQPSSNSWSLGPAMCQARKALCAVFYRGDVYAIGGCVNDNYALNSLEKLSVATQSWTELSPMTQERKYASAAVTGDKILVIGGFQKTSSSALGSCELYCPLTDQWSVVVDLVFPRAAGGIATVGNKVYVLGGRHDRQAQVSVESYDEESDRWIVEETVLPFGCAWFQCAVATIPKAHIN